MSQSLWVQIERVNATCDRRYSSEPAQDSGFTSSEVGRLFLALQREYGRCVSKVYVDRRDGEALPIGWVFHKRREYERGEGTYLDEVWVTVSLEPKPVRPVRIDRMEEV